MSAITEQMSYEDLNAFLKSIDAEDAEIYNIHTFLNSMGKCTVGRDDSFIYITRVSAYFYDVSLL